LLSTGWDLLWSTYILNLKFLSTSTPVSASEVTTLLRYTNLFIIIIIIIMNIRKVVQNVENTVVRSHSRSLAIPGSGHFWSTSHL